MLAVTDSVLYVRGPSATGPGVAFENAGEFDQTASAAARPRLFLDEGDLLNTGTWVQGMGTVVFNGASGTTRNLTLGTATLHKLRIDNPAVGNDPGGVVLGSNGSVDGVVHFANGHLYTTGLLHLRLSATARVFGEKDESYVRGCLVQKKTLPGGSAAIDFGNMGFLVNPQNQSFTLEVERRTGLLMPNFSYGQNTDPQLSSNHGIDRIWKLTTDDAPSGPVTLTLAWLPDNDHGLNFNGTTRAQVWRSVNGGASWVRQGSSQLINERSITVSTTLVSDALYTVSTTAVPLPVVLTSFSATARALDAVLKWSTASESNSAWFVIERSPDGRSWVEVGRQAAAGNSSAALSYSATDPGAGRQAPAFYYRLRQLDRDGTANYSGVQHVEFRKNLVFAVEAFPVPMQAFLTLDVVMPAAGPLQIELFDMTGRLVISQKVTAPMGSSRYQVDVRALASGSYTLRTVQGGRQISRRLLRE
ncbi:T9SS type A sorting domain-containing protein [Hymenobacter sp. BT683]|uniref:T9SS type A sorting domain-containing protein n=1 Tax=Hymenobacter jeongseonensis TaxID=2791027 RepID=A0ABS0IHH9_9BACT|nr:T9SS type A sorting domain-containing protein [Hymenobacter jeongseonensis]MBF9237817.1 T9SS type A sorting domain-containing protein [Hymenobacter jeongseonensis]